MTQPYNSRPFRRAAEPKCRDDGPGAYACSLKPGHTGDHVALGMDGQTLKTWGRTPRRVKGNVQ